MPLRRAVAALAHACGGPAALTWAAWFVTLPLSVVVALSPESVESTRSLEAGAIAAATAHVGLIPVFIVARRWLRRRRPLLAVLGIYALLGALRGVVVVVIEQSIAPSSGTSLLGRVVVSAVLAVVGFSTIAVVVDRMRTYRSARQRLREALQRVQALGPVPSQLADVEAVLGELARPSGITRDELATGIRNVIEDQVRPLSHRLLDDRHRPDETTATGLPEARMRLRLPPPNPWLVALALEGGAFVPVARQVGLVTALVNAIIVSLMIVAVGYPLNFVIRRAVGASVVGALILIVGAYASVGVLAMLLSDLIFRVFGSVEPLYVTAIPFAAIWAILVSVATGADQEAQSTEADLSRLLRQEVIDVTVSRVNARALARRMHGNVQSELTAIMMGLRHPTSPLSVQDAQSRLREVGRSLVPSLAEQNSIESSGGDEISSFMDVWSQALDVRWQVDHECLARLSRDPVAWVGVRGVIMEGLTNVVRHATEARAVVGIAAGPGDYLVEISSPGIVNAAVPGVGLQVLSETCGPVRLREQDGQVVLAVPVAPIRDPDGSRP